MAHPIANFRYERWKHDPTPQVLMLGNWTHPRTRNPLTGGINLNYLDEKQTRKLHRHALKIFSERGLYNRYWKGRELAPEVFEEFYRLYNRNFIYPIEVEEMLSEAEVDLSHLLKEKPETIGKEKKSSISSTINLYRDKFGSHRFVKVVDGKNVSAMQVMHAKGQQPRVANVYTHPDHRRKGYATELNAAAQAYFKNKMIHSTDLSPEGKSFVRRVTNESTQEQLSAALHSRAVKHFGLTPDLEKAGFVMPNGDMLDFSGKSKAWDRERTHTMGEGSRAIHHQIISRIYPPSYSADPRGREEKLMQHFMRNTGAVRVGYEHQEPRHIFVDHAEPLTDAQKRILAKAHSEGDEWAIDSVQGSQKGLSHSDFIRALHGKGEWMKTESFLDESVSHKELQDRAVKHFGLTHDAREAGYILPDGRMLDLSGSPGVGMRGLDHRDINHVYPKNFPKIDPSSYGAHSARMHHFMRGGVVRFHLTHGSREGGSMNIDHYKLLTPAQKRVISDAHHTYGVTSWYIDHPKGSQSGSGHMELMHALNRSGTNMDESDDYFSIGHPPRNSVITGEGRPVDLWWYDGGIKKKHGNIYDEHPPGEREFSSAYGRADHAQRTVSLMWHPHTRQERRKDAIRKRVYKEWPDYRVREFDAEDMHEGTVSGTMGGFSSSNLGAISALPMQGSDTVSLDRGKRRRYASRSAKKKSLSMNLESVIAEKLQTPVLRSLSVNEAESLFCSAGTMALRRKGDRPVRVLETQKGTAVCGSRYCAVVQPDGAIQTLVLPGNISEGDEDEAFKWANDLPENQKCYARALISGEPATPQECGVSPEEAKEVKDTLAQKFGINTDTPAPDTKESFDMMSQWIVNGVSRRLDMNKRRETVEHFDAARQHNDLATGVEIVRQLTEAAGIERVPAEIAELLVNESSAPYTPPKITARQFESVRDEVMAFLADEVVPNLSEEDKTALSQSFDQSVAQGDYTNAMDTADRFVQISKIDPKVWAELMRRAAGGRMNNKGSAGFPGGAYPWYPGVIPFRPSGSNLPIGESRPDLLENKSIHHQFISRRSLKNGRLWVPEKRGISGGYFPVHNPEALSDTPRYHTVTLHPDGKLRIKPEYDVRESFGAYTREFDPEQQSRTRQHLNQGLGSWINAYKMYQEHGQHRQAAEVKKNIRAAISQHNLHAPTVYAKLAEVEGEPIETGVVPDANGRKFISAGGIPRLRRFVGATDSIQSSEETTVAEAHREPADEEGARELELFIHHSSEPLYRMHQAIHANLNKKRAKGMYDSEKAVKAFHHLANAGSLRYGKEFGTGGHAFNPATRHMVAQSLRDQFDRGHKVESIMDEGKWSASVRTHWHPPEGFFDRSGEAIAKSLLGSGSKAKAMQRLNFYTNRAGANLSSEARSRLQRAKQLIHRTDESLFVESDDEENMEDQAQALANALEEPACVIHSDNANQTLVVGEQEWQDTYEGNSDWEVEYRAEPDGETEWDRDSEDDDEENGGDWTACESVQEAMRISESVMEAASQVGLAAALRQDGSYTLHNAQQEMVGSLCECREGWRSYRHENGVPVLAGVQYGENALQEALKLVKREGPFTQAHGVYTVHHPETNAIVGLITKEPSTANTKHPWKAFRYDGGRTKPHTMLGAHYGAMGRDAALKQIAQDCGLKESELMVGTEDAGGLAEAEEFPIWGVPPGHQDETLLHTKAKSYDEAMKIKDILEKEHGCKKVRIQRFEPGRDNPQQMFRNAVKKPKNESLVEASLALMYGDAQIVEAKEKMQFVVRTGHGTVTDDNVSYPHGFTDFVGWHSSTPRQHAGWQSVKYKGKRYQLHGGIRTHHFISLASPLKESDADASVPFTAFKALPGPVDSAGIDKSYHVFQFADAGAAGQFMASLRPGDEVAHDGSGVVKFRPFQSPTAPVDPVTIAASAGGVPKSVVGVEDADYDDNLVKVEPRQAGPDFPRRVPESITEATLALIDKPQPVVAYPVPQARQLTESAVDYAVNRLREGKQHYNWDVVPSGPNYRRKYGESEQEVTVTFPEARSEDFAAALQPFTDVGTVPINSNGGKVTARLKLPAEALESVRSTFAGRDVVYA